MPRLNSVTIPGSMISHFRGSEHVAGHFCWRKLTSQAADTAVAGGATDTIAYFPEWVGCRYYLPNSTSQQTLRRDSY